MEALEPLMQDVRRISVWLHRLFVELSLGIGGWDQTVLGYIVAETVGGLRVLACRFKVGVADRVAKLLEVGVWASLQLLVELWLVATVVDAQVNDFLRRLGVCKVECGSGVEFDILGSLGCVEHLAWNVEYLHGEAPRLWDTVLRSS